MTTALATVASRPVAFTVACDSSRTSSNRVSSPRAPTSKTAGAIPSIRPARLTPTPRSVPTPSRAAAEEEKDADASIEPCLVGWSETDENGVEAYCCEQPGGGMECRTVSNEHTECELVTNEDGELVVNCSVDDEEEDKAAKAREDDKAAKAAALRHL